MAHGGLAVVFVLNFTEHATNPFVFELSGKLLTPDCIAIVGVFISRDKGLKALAAITVLVLCQDILSASMGPLLVGSDVVLVLFGHISRLYIILGKVKADLEHSLARLACCFLHILDDDVVTAQIDGCEITPGLGVVIIVGFLHCFILLFFNILLMP